MIKSEKETNERKTNRYGLELFSKEKSQFISFYKERLEAALGKLEIERRHFMKGLIPRIIASPFIFLLIYYAFHEFTLFIVPAAPFAIIVWIGLYCMLFESKIKAKANVCIIH